MFEYLLISTLLRVVCFRGFSKVKSSTVLMVQILMYGNAFSIVSF